MYWYKTPLLLKTVFKNLYWNFPANEKSIYLTFDDGPTPGVTEAVLDILEDFGAKGTFFCLGKNIEKYPDIFEKIVAKGHAIGNHTYHHLNGWENEDDDYFLDIKLCSTLISISLFRPPYGKISLSQIDYLSKQYKIIMWDVLSGDFDPGVTKEKCLENVLTNSDSGSIVVFHDSIKAKEKVVYSLPLVLEHFSKLGYQFPKITF